MNFLILHGTLGNPEGNWFPYLAGELEKLGHKTLRPQLPKDQTPDNWQKAIGEAVEKLGGVGDSVVIVAHSMSCLAVCRYLETRASPIRACFFVAPFAQDLPVLEPVKSLNLPFVQKYVDWAKVRQNGSRFICFAGSNDPYVPTAIARDFADKLNAEYVVIENGGHLNSDSGFATFPQLLETIKRTLLTQSTQRDTIGL